jgi:CRP-like cAMP-binding protein
MDFMVEVPFQQGEILFREGEVGDFVCLIVKGDVEVIKELGDQRVVLGVVKAGEFVGEMGVVNIGDKAGHNVGAKTSQLRLI